MNDRPRRSPTLNRRAVLNGQVSAESGVRRHKPDYWLLVFAALLMTIGLVVIYSISPALAASQDISQSYFITKELINVGLGVAVFAAAALLPTWWWRKIAGPLAAAALIASAVVMITPTDEIYQAHRWIRAGGLSFQVAELVKFALLIGLAVFLTKQWRSGRLADSNATLKPLLILVAVVGLLVAKLQSDLGSAAVVVAMIIMMAYAAGIPLKKVLLIGGCILALGALAISTSGYRRDRLAAFIHPESNCQGSGYQACQALISVGSGGVFGMGLGYGVQAYGYLPEASNDSIFAIIAEKFGFVGTLAIIVIYTAFIARLRRLIEHTANQFNRLVLVGVLAWISTQMIINIGAMIGLLPLKGITLPFISQGGTSLIFLTAALGLVFQISRYTSYSVTEPKTSISQQKSYGPFDGRRIGRPHNAAVVAGRRA